MSTANLINALLDEYNNIKQRLKKYNKTYFICTKTILLLTSINWILSGILVIGSYYSFKTITSFATNILLVITKLSIVRSSCVQYMFFSFLLYSTQSSITLK